MSTTETRHLSCLLVAFAIACGGGRTSLGRLAGRGDAAVDGIGDGSGGMLRRDASVLPQGGGGNGGGNGGAVVDRDAGRGDGTGPGGGGGAGAGAAGGVRGGRSGGAGVASGGTAGQAGRGGFAVGGATGGTSGASSVAGSSGRGGTAGGDGGPVDLRAGGPETGSDGPVRWRNSTDNLCVPFGLGSGSASVYSDDRSLFVMAWNLPSSGLTPDSPATIWKNDGSGWRTHFTWSKDAQFPSRYYGGIRAGIRGRADGSLFAFGRFGCAIELIDDLGEHCSGALTIVADLFVTGANAAYATDGYYLLKYDGSLWTQVGEKFPDGSPMGVGAQALWADSSTVVAGGAQGYVLTIENEKTVTVLPRPGNTNISTVWAFGVKDIWIGTEAGELFHWDGAGWLLKAMSPGEVRSGIHLWGMAGHLFVVGYGLFAEWDGAALRNALPADQRSRQFTDVWGNSPTEVFGTSVTGPNDSVDACNAVQLWWYDGTVARRI